jgi:hypothetical protein
MEGLARGHVPDESMDVHPSIVEEVREGFAKRNLTPPSNILRFVCELRAGADSLDVWEQEFEGKFLSDAQNYIPIELILAAENDEATESLPPGYKQESRVFMGVDIGRKKHRTVVWLLQQVGDILWTVAVHVLDKLPFQDQYKVIAGYMQQLQIYKSCVDATGMGSQIAEQLDTDFPGRVEPIQFTLQSKDTMFTLMKRTFEERRYRIPQSPIIRADINGIKKSVTKAGNLVYSAAETQEGHSDRGNALALATVAAQQPVVLDLSQDNFVGLKRPQILRDMNVPTWESRDYTTLWGGPVFGGRPL